MYALCMSISCLFSSGITLGVRQFRDLIDFGLHCSLSVSLILLYFISTRAWVENLHIKNCIKNLMIVMPSYFTRTIGTRLCEEGHFSNILKIQTSQYPLLSFTLDYGQGYTQVTVTSRVNPKWIQKIKIKFENLKPKFKH